MHRPHRREFLGAVAAGTLALSSARSEGRVAPKLRLGVIGVGWYGMVDAQAALRVGGVEIAAVCDVDTAHLEASAAKLEKLQGKRPATFAKYQDLVALDGLDAVIIATPPHWHALQLIAALEHGDRPALDRHSQRQEREARGARSEDRPRHAAHGRLPRCDALARSRDVLDRGRISVDRDRAARDGRLRDDVDAVVGRVLRAGHRQPGRREAPTARVPHAVEAPLQGVARITRAPHDVRRATSTRFRT